MCFVAHCVPFWFFLGSNSPIFIIFIPRFRHRAQSSKWNPSDSSWNRGSFPRCCPHCAMGHHGTLGDLEPLVDALPNADAAQLRSCSRQGPTPVGHGGTFGKHKRKISPRKMGVWSLNIGFCGEKPWDFCAREGGHVYDCICILYPLVNVYITMESHHFWWENSL